MRLRFSLKSIAAIGSLALALTAAGCEHMHDNGNSANTNNSAAAAAPPAGLPADATPFADAPGFYKAGPTGNVSLKFTAPADGSSVNGNAVAPTFTITGYPIYQDPARKKGQHIHVIL